MSNDPWHEIKPPDSTATINSIRVNPDFHWNFFWARDIDRKCMLVLNCTDEVACKQKLPRLKEIEVRVFNSSDTQSAALIFRLMDSSHRDIFYRLCLDIMEGASTAETEREVFDISIRRTWRWHHNYSSDLWIEGRKRLYKLTELFPSVRATDLRTGVSDVLYSIALLECEKFIVPFEHLTSLLSGENDAD